MIDEASSSGYPHGGGSLLGKVTAFIVAGLDLWFNSSDHLPPHFHARKPGAWEIRIFFLECTPGNLVVTVKWPPNVDGPSRKERDALIRGAIDHRPELLVEWENKVVVKEDI